MLTGKYDGGIPPDTRATLKGYEWLAERLTDPAKLRHGRRRAPIAADLRLHASRRCRSRGA